MATPPTRPSSLAPSPSGCEELTVSCPIEAGSIADRLTHWCDQDALQQENAVLEALACCREWLHALPSSTQSGDAVPFPAGAVATLVCSVQSQVNHSARCGH